MPDSDEGRGGKEREREREDKRDDWKPSFDHLFPPLIAPQSVIIYHLWTSALPESPHSLIRLKSRANHEICDSLLISPDFRNREDICQAYLFNTIPRRVWSVSFFRIRIKVGQFSEKRIAILFLFVYFDSRSSLCSYVKFPYMNLFICTLLMRISISHLL